MKRLLLVEDDKDIIKLLRINLGAPAFDITSSVAGIEAVRIASENPFDLILLDIMLPDIDGIEVCRRLRANQISTPIIMLTARSEEIDKVLALEIGADDYITKPFSMRELIARIKAMLRRAENVPVQTGESESEIQFRDLFIDVGKRKAMMNENRIDLTQKEFDLLLILAQNPGKTFSRIDLLRQVWGYTIDGYEHTVTSHINRLRIKIEKDLNLPVYIITSWGVGYRFSDEIK